jgi:hypothetical protein
MNGIATLEDEPIQMKARQQRTADKRKRPEARRSKKDEQRRRLRVGAIVLGKVQREEPAQKDVREWLDAELERPVDRALFNL